MWQKPLNLPVPLKIPRCSPTRPPFFKPNLHLNCVTLNRKTQSVCLFRDASVRLILTIVQRILVVNTQLVLTKWTIILVIVRSFAVNILYEKKSFNEKYIYQENCGIARRHYKCRLHIPELPGSYCSMIMIIIMKATKRLRIE